jgi:phosphate starvation-inducible PhoH-like protein
MSRRKSNAKSKYDDFDTFLNKNPIPIPTEYNRNQKTFTTHDMKSIQPMTRNQQKVFDLWEDDVNIVLAGSAGTGKTLCTLYLALKEILDTIENRKYDKIVIVRSAVASRDIGFLPGTAEEKMEVYEQPYMQIFDFLFKKKNQYKFMKEVGLVEFHSTAYLRGTTFDNCIIVLDEAASLNYHEISTVMTRVGTNTKIIAIGDTKQNDLIYKKNDTSGFMKFLDISTRIPSMRNVYFTVEDIVRSGFVKEFLIADEQYEEREELNRKRHNNQ